MRDAERENKNEKNGKHLKTRQTTMSLKTKYLKIHPSHQWTLIAFRVPRSAYRGPL